MPAFNGCPLYAIAGYDIHHEIHSEGSSHITNWDAESITRYSWDTDADGNRSSEHPTDQNKSKGDPDRR